MYKNKDISFNECSHSLYENINASQRSDSSHLIDNFTQRLDCIRQGEEKRNRLFTEGVASKQPQGYMEANEAAINSVEGVEDNESRRKKIIEIQVHQFQDENQVFQQGSVPLELQKRKEHEFQNLTSTISVEGQRAGKNGITVTTTDIGSQTPFSKKENQKILVESEDKETIQSNSEHDYRKGSFIQPNPVKKKAPKKKGRFFSVLLFVNGFLFQLKRMLLFYRPQKLNSMQLELIGDLAAQTFEQDGYGVHYTQCCVDSSSYGEGNQEHHTHTHYSISSIFRSFSRSKTLVQEHSNKKKSNFMKKLSKSKCFILISRLIRKSLNQIQRTLRSILRKVPLIDPFSRLFRLWELLIFVCDSINLIYIPFRLSFASVQLLDTYIYSVTFPIIYGMNIFFNMNVSVYKRGTLIVSRQQIFTIYIQSFFVIDALAFLAKFINPIFYLGRILYTNPTLEQLKSFLLMNSKLNAVEQFLSLSLTTLIFSHLFSCAWHWIGKYNLEFNDGWMVQFDLMKEPTLVRYITCFYYAVVTMSTIGYGDITAKTTNERFLMIFTIFFASGLYGYTLNAIGIQLPQSIILIIFYEGTILSNMKSQSESYTKKQAQLEEYLALHEVDMGLRNRARRYIEYAQEQESMLKRDGQENLNLLSSILKEEIQKDINKKILAKARAIFSIISLNTKFFEKLATIIKESTFGPEEIIYMQQSSQPPSLYIVAYGEVELFMKKRDHLNSLKVVKNLHSGSIFGQYEFFTNNQTNCLSARSVGVTYVSSISLEDFLNLLQEFDEEREKFCHIRDQILLNRQNRLIRLHCQSCQSDKHCIQDCPYLSYDPVKFNHLHLLRVTKKIFKQIFEADIKSKKSKIRARKKVPTLIKRNELFKDVSRFQDDKKDIINTMILNLFPFQEEDQDNYEGSLNALDISKQDDVEQISQQDKVKQGEGEGITESGSKQKLSPLIIKGNENINRKGMLSSKGSQDIFCQIVDQEHQSLFSPLSLHPQQYNHQQLQILSASKISENLENESVSNLESETSPCWNGEQYGKEVKGRKNSINSQVKERSLILESLNDNIAVFPYLFPSKSPIKDVISSPFLQKQSTQQSNEKKQSFPNDTLDSKSYNHTGNQHFNFIRENSTKSKTGQFLSNNEKQLFVQSFHQNQNLKGMVHQGGGIISNPNYQQQQQQSYLTNFTASFRNQGNQQPFEQQQQAQMLQQQQQQQILQQLIQMVPQLNKKINIGPQDEAQQLVEENNSKSIELYSWENSTKSLFEIQKTYLIYFPHNNYEVVSQKWNDSLKYKSFKRAVKRSRRPYYLINLKPVKQNESKPQSIQQISQPLI